MLIKNIPLGQGQRICIGPDVTIEVHPARNGQVKVAIDAPRVMLIQMQTKAEPKVVE